jgi:carbonic anhydrase
LRVDKNIFDKRWLTKLKTMVMPDDLFLTLFLQESVNCSLANLLTYPWVEEKVRNGELAIHGAYYDFVDCAFEKWTLDYKESNLKDKGGRVAVKDRAFWF